MTGLIGPFYVVYVAKLSGGVEKLGLAFGIMVIVRSCTTYFAGFYSDKMGRKPLLYISAYSNAIVLFLYTLITEPYQLYILQAMLGVVDGISGTVSTSFLGDLTVKARRGRTIGKFNAIVGMSSGVGLFIGGYMIKIYGFKFIFYFASIIVALSTIFLFFLNEDANEE